jgi:sulfate adenylyltransferase subunit 1 (EFTu-like GTPase family)
MVREFDQPDHAVTQGAVAAQNRLGEIQLRDGLRIGSRQTSSYGHFTTRQNVQFNWIPLDRSADVMDLLATVDMHVIQTLAFALPVQWVEKQNLDTQDRRVFGGRLAAGRVQAGDAIQVFPGRQTAQVAQVLNAVRVPGTAWAYQSAGIVLDREIDVSRGDWLFASGAGTELNHTETR